MSGNGRAGLPQTRVMHMYFRVVPIDEMISIPYVLGASVAQICIVTTSSAVL